MSTVVNDMKITTMIKFTNDVIKRVTGMTFLYDPNWSPYQTGYPGDSLPFAFFEVVKISENQHNEVSNRRILLYEEEKKSIQVSSNNIAGIGGAVGTGGNVSDSMIRPSVLQVVSDNVVVDPLQYKLEVLIPYGFITRLFGTIGEAIASVFAFFEGGVQPSTLAVSGALKMMVNYADKFMRVVDVFYPTVSASYNRNSLMAMARNRSVLKMKSWDSWDYKYVIIKDINISKEGMDDNYFRGSIDVQEVPVLTIGKEGVRSKRSISELRAGAGEALKQSFDSILGETKGTI